MSDDRAKNIRLVLEHLLTGATYQAYRQAQFSEQDDSMVRARANHEITRAKQMLLARYSIWKETNLLSSPPHEQFPSPEVLESMGHLQKLIATCSDLQMMLDPAPVRAVAIWNCLQMRDDFAQRVTFLDGELLKISTGFAASVQQLDINAFLAGDAPVEALITEWTDGVSEAIRSRRAVLETYAECCS